MERQVRELEQLRNAAREIFATALRAVDSYEAITRTVRLDGSRLTVVDAQLELNNYQGGIYAIAIGKAALSMAVALEDVLGKFLISGVIAGPVAGQPHGGTLAFPPRKFSTAWRWCEGGHPLPNETSLLAATESFRLLERANTRESLIIFLVSGGGSAMIEWPRDDSITLADLREANRQLISCGASISEVNAVRRGFSAVKGGKLNALAPQAEQLTLIISDTNRGDEANVASGPTLKPPATAPDPNEIVDRYNLGFSLPASILATISQHDRDKGLPSRKIRSSHHVLLDNQTGIDAAAAKARQLGFAIEVADDINEQAIDAGCDLLVSRLAAFKERVGANQKAVCLLSGGEFSCPVRGDGMGGRNLETALRCAINFDQRRRRVELGSPHLIALSAGTDGLDGNSPAAGALADETTLTRGRELGLDAEESVMESDSFAFLNSLGDAILTGPTGTNVRDLRVLLAGTELEL